MSYFTEPPRFTPPPRHEPEEAPWWRFADSPVALIALPLVAFALVILVLWFVLASGPDTPGAGTQSTGVVPRATSEPEFVEPAEPDPNARPVSRPSHRPTPSPSETTTTPAQPSPSPSPKPKPTMTSTPSPTPTVAPTATPSVSTTPTAELPETTPIPVEPPPAEDDGEAQAAL